MASGKSTYLKNKEQNYLFNNGAWVRPTTVYLDLYTAAPTAAGGGTKVTGGAYAAVAIALNSTNFPVTTTGNIVNALDIDFITPTADWGTVVAWISAELRQP